MRGSYKETAERGILAKRLERALEGLGRCMLCPRKCGVDRLQGEVGDCRTGRLAQVSSFGPHFGEERPLVGRAGSGSARPLGAMVGTISRDEIERRTLRLSAENRPSWLLAAVIGVVWAVSRLAG